MATRTLERSAAKRKRGPVCSVCLHPKRAVIDRALVEGESALKIAARFRRLSDDAIRRHREAHLPVTLARAAEVAEHKVGSDVLAQLDRCLERANLLFDACDRWLRDPDDPTRYDLGPRAEDLRVIYVATNGDGKPVRKKATLAELLTRARGEAPDIRLVETKHADPRELVLHTCRRLEGLVELLARVRDELPDGPSVNVIISPEWTRLRDVILTTLEPYPDARNALASALESHAIARA